MKAKEYADKYNSGEISIAEVITALFHESGDLIRTRNIRSNEALFSILNEQDRKFRAFHRRMKDRDKWKSGGFQFMVKSEMPDIYMYWINHPGTLKEGA